VSGRATPQSGDRPFRQRAAGVQGTPVFYLLTFYSVGDERRLYLS